MTKHPRQAMVNDQLQLQLQQQAEPFSVSVERDSQESADVAIVEVKITNGVSPIGADMNIENAFYDSCHCLCNRNFPASLQDNLIAAIWALVSAVSSFGAIYLSKTIYSDDAGTHRFDSKSSHTLFNPRESER